MGRSDDAIREDWDLPVVSIREKDSASSSSSWSDVAALLHRLADTQRNLPLFLTPEEHRDLREAAYRLERHFVKTVCRSLALLVLVVGLCASFTACASAPPNVSPAAQLAFTNTRVIGGLDVLRNAAIDANAQVPPLVSTDTTRKIVTYHRSALLVIQASPNGWQATVIAGLNQTVLDLPPAESQFLTPYVALVTTLIQEIAQP